MKKADHQQFVKQMEDTLLELGGIPTDECYPYTHKFETEFGPLLIGVENRESDHYGKGSYWPMLYGRFVNGSNPLTTNGKWNPWAGEMDAVDIPIVIEDFAGRIERLTQKQTA